MNRLVHQAQRFITKNAPTILTCVGGIGVIATSVMAVKATPKALDLLKEAKEEKGEDLTKLETVKVAGPVYIPAILVGVSTVSCIFGANVLGKRSQASIMSAYALLDSTYRDYKDKVEELYGEGASVKVREEIARDKYEEEDILGDDNDGKQLFFDYFSGRYFRATPEQVQRAEYVINRHLVMREYAYLNEFYEELGIEPIESGYDYGWSNGANMDRYWQSWVDFNHEKTVTDDGLECTIIVMHGEPILGFEDYS